tara:strand:+ start:492 stop:1079 length:588 start_codon:yes stop_codon:yes gene_type:complete
MINQILIISIAYLLGAISFGIIVSKIFKISDPRTFGSKNTGATNVMRSGNKYAAILTLIGDTLKGALVVTFAIKINLTDYEIICVSLAVLIGHIYPVYYKFKGGKGVATALGILLGLNQLLALSVIIIWILMFFIFRYSSLSAIVASLMAPIFSIYIFNESLNISIIYILIATLIILRHKPNIKNLIQGVEPKFK